MKNTGFLVLVFLLALPVMAQERKDDFSSFLEREMADFDKFVDDANKEFINFLRNPWKEFKSEKPVPKPVRPEPVKPVVYDESKAPKGEKPVCLTIEEILDLSTSEGKQKPIVKVNDVEDITFDEPTVIVKKKDKPTVVVVKDKPKDKPVVSSEDKPVAQPEKKPVVIVEDGSSIKPEEQPVDPVVEPAQKADPVVVPAPKPVAPVVKPVKQTPLYAGGTGRMKINYAAQDLYLPAVMKGKCHLKSLKENDVADAYEALYSTDYKALLKDCKQLASDLNLNGWGVYLLLKAVADASCGSENESVVMQQFLLNEMGYKAKMARKADTSKMLLLVALDNKIYGRPYWKQGGLCYYMLNENYTGPFYTCQQDAPNAKKQLELNFSSAPVFQGATVSTTHQAEGSAAKVTVSVPKALMDFYKDYPSCEYSVYAKAAVNPEVANTLLSSLSPLVKGKSETEAANILINFVQTAFQYATDDEQFGYEKPFFVEELFYYPYSDCEDRAVLYAYLVKSLLGLDVVFLDYPNHIATAVRFNESVNGDYLMVDGQKYTVCDPTYIGATIGMTMQAYKSVAAKVLKY